jgi:hypothetical protein
LRREQIGKDRDVHQIGVGKGLPKADDTNGD